MAANEHHVELDPKLLMDSDEEDDDEEEEAKQHALIEKSKDQIKEEESKAWRKFIYPTWATPMIYVLFLFCLVNLILTLEQEHVSHGWSRPYDLYPNLVFKGGWGDQSVRWAGAILGLAATGFAIAWVPNAYRWRLLFTLLFVSGVLLMFQFGYDLDALYDANELPECKASPDVVSRKIRCEFDRFRATVVMDIFASLGSFFLSFFILYQLLSGSVSRRMVYNERNNVWEKYTLQGDEPFYNAFPKVYRKQRLPFALMCIFVLVCQASLIALGGTQTAHPYFKSHNVDTPMFNYNKNTPRDVYIIPGNQPAGIGRETGRGGWPTVNFELRLSANAGALVVLAFLIQWRRDGRTAQLWVLSFLLALGIVYTAAFFLDLEELDKVLDLGGLWARAHGSNVVTARYMTVVVFDGFCAFGLLLFSLSNLINMFNQAKHPINQTEVHPYGWWCFGENAAIKKKKEEALALEEA